VFAFLQVHRILTSRPPLPEEGAIVAEVAPADSEAPEAFKNQDGDEAKGSLEGTTPLSHLPQLSLKTKVQAIRGNIQRT
jgi:hypothetical protein